MKVYRLSTNDEDFSSFFLPIKSEMETLESFAKRFLYTDFDKALDKWIPLILLENIIKKKPDFALLMNEYIIISENAKVLLDNTLKDSVLLLPLLNDVCSYYIICPIIKVDALDKEKSIFKKLPFSNKILKVLHFEFIPELIKDLIIFKVPEFVSDIFVTDKFRKIYNQKNLKGLEFTENETIWEFF